jgi:predicted MFS family arabinose efflux permease
LQFVSQIAPYFANTQGASDAEGGGRTIPFSIGNAVGALLAGQVIKRFGIYKRLSIVSLIFCIANMVVILLRWTHPIGTLEAILTTFPFGLFGGIILSAQFIGLYHSSSKQNIVTAISMYYMSQQIGIALGISFSSGLLKHQLKPTLNKVMRDIPGAAEIIKQILADSSAVRQLPEAIQSLVRQAYLSSFRVVPVLVISLQLVTILPMISTTEQS